MLIQNRPWFQFLRQLSNFSQEFLFRLCLVLNQRITRYCHACTLPTPPPPKKQNKNKTKQFPSKLNSRPKQTGLLYDTNFFYSGRVTGVTAFMRANAVFRQLKVSSGRGVLLENFGWAAVMLRETLTLYQTKDVVFNTGLISNLTSISISYARPDPTTSASLCKHLRPKWLKNSSLQGPHLPLQLIERSTPPALNEQLPFYRNRYNLAMF